MLSKNLAGPSPRGWGELDLSDQQIALMRTIPTRVGRTKTATVTLNVFTDHPHAGGENDGRGKVSGNSRGPSPRGWGERPVVLSGSGDGRTIPTRVGRTAEPPSGGYNLPDHPHAGGENNTLKSDGFRLSGPSPRGWGELRDGVRFTRRRRTIPTRVGRTVTRSRHQRSRPDHPHAGGENMPSSRTATS